MIKDLCEGTLCFLALLLTAEEGSKLHRWLFPGGFLPGNGVLWVFLGGWLGKQVPREGERQQAPMEVQEIIVKRKKKLSNGEDAQALESVAQGCCGVPGPTVPLLVARLWRHLIQHAAGNDS